MARRRYLKSSTTFYPNAPNKALWVVAVILGILALLSHFVFIEFFTPNKFWIVSIAFVLLVIGTTAKKI